MSSPIYQSLKHSAYRLVIRDDEALFLDVLCFQGEEHLSQTFKYNIEFTCEEQDLPIERLLNRDASFLIFPAPHTLPKANKWGLTKLEVMPLRTLYGVVTGLKRLSDSPDEARYELTLEPRLALAGRGQQYRIYQQKSVPEIIDGILRSRHGFRGQDFYFNLTREYPRRDQVTDTHADEPTRKQAESDRNNRQAKVRINRMEGMAGWRYGIAPKPVVAPGVPDFDPDIAQTQLREAAEEFRDEYQGPGFLVSIVALTFRRSVITGVIAHQYAADARAERERMKAAGEALVSRLFPAAAIQTRRSIGDLRPPGR
jgi:type VI secretion system secreted protein VgrG